MQCVTPSPLSSSIAVINPSANRDINACIPYCSLLIPNFSNISSSIPALFSVGFIMASVMNTDDPAGLLTPICWKEYFINISMSYQLLTLPSEVGWLSSNSERYLDASLPTIISWNRGIAYSELNLFTKRFLEAEHGSSDQAGEGGLGEIITSKAHLHVACAWIADDGIVLHITNYNSIS